MSCRHESKHFSNLKWFCLPSSLVHSLVIPLHLALWLQQQLQSGSGLSNEGLISFSLVWVGFKPSALTPLPTVSSHKGGARCLPTLLWCACSWSVSGSWVLFRVWNYLRRLLANASGALALLLCLYASICVCRSGFLSSPRERMSKSHYGNIFTKTTIHILFPSYNCKWKVNTQTHTHMHETCAQHSTRLAKTRQSRHLTFFARQPWPQRLHLCWRYPVCMCVCVFVSLGVYSHAKCAHLRRRGERKRRKTNSPLFTLTWPGD